MADFTTPVFDVQEITARKLPDLEVLHFSYVHASETTTGTVALVYLPAGKIRIDLARSRLYVPALTGPVATVSLGTEDDPTLFVDAEDASSDVVVDFGEGYVMLDSETGIPLVLTVAGDDGIVADEVAYGYVAWARQV